MLAKISLAQSFLPYIEVPFLVMNIKARKKESNSNPLIQLKLQL